MFDVTVIGAGVIGGMIARELAKYRLSVCIVEKENDVACGASKANSGIVHGGYDPEPETLKAELNIAGVPLLYEAAKQLHVPIKNNGSLIVAFSEEENAHLQKLYERGLINGVADMQLLTGEEVRALEPALSADITMALHVPMAGIVCPYALTIAAVGNAMDNGVTFHRNFEVVAVDEQNGVYTVTAANGASVQSRFVVNCAGAYSDKISAMLGETDFTIIPRAGEYLLLDKTVGATVSHTIFQVPSAAGKGILVSPTVDGNLLTGPTALMVDDPADTKTTVAGMDTVMTLAKKSVPTVDFRQVITSFSGVRASEKNGDFIIRPMTSHPQVLQVAAIDSPGLTSAVAIAQYAVKQLETMGLTLEINPDFCGEREDTHAFRHMDNAQKNAYIAGHPDYGKIVCRCETVSEGEIRDAIRRNPRAMDVDGVKRRTRSGMGRCQGGFCSPYVMRLIAEENGVDMTTVTKKGANSALLLEVQDV